jgi:hypothetical protein
VKSDCDSENKVKNIRELFWHMGYFGKIKDKYIFVSALSSASCIYNSGDRRGDCEKIMLAFVYMLTAIPLLLRISHRPDQHDSELEFLPEEGMTVINIYSHPIDAICIMQFNLQRTSRVLCALGFL